MTVTAEQPATKLSPEAFNAKARAIRATCVQMAFDARQGHLNGAMSSVEILLALFHGFLNISCDKPKDPARDRFIFSKGHACKSLYAVMADAGLFPMEWLINYGKNDTHLAVHPCIHALEVLEASAGSLGHGLGLATGRAYALRLEKNPARCVALLSDGECNEGSTWEAAMFAAAQKLDSVIAIVDYNRVQSVGMTDDLVGHTSFEEKFRAFGWATRVANGHDVGEMISVLRQAPFTPGKPSVIIANTRAGAGVSFMENQVLWHYRVPSKDDLANAFKELNAQPIYGRSQA